MYEVKNIVNKKYVESSSKEIEYVRDFNGKKVISYENSNVQDVSFALKVALSKKNEMTASEIIKKIKKVCKNYLRDEEKIKLIVSVTGSPITYVKSMLEKIRNWMFHIDDYVKNLFGSVENLENGHDVTKNSKVVYLPRGLTGVILAGDEAGLAGYVIPQLLLSKNPIIIRPSSQDLITSYELVKAFVEEGFNIQFLSWSHNSRPDLGKFLVKNCDQLVIFGNDKTVNDLILYEENGVLKDYRNEKNIIEYTSGKSASIVMEDSHIIDAVDKVIIGACSNKGSECTNSKKVYVHEKVYKDFVRKLKKESEKIKYGNPLNEDSFLGIIGNKNVETIKEIAKNHNVLFKDFKDNSMNLLLVEDENNSSRFTREEVPGPALSLIPFKDLNDVVRKANEALEGSHSTATTIFTNNEEVVDFLSRHLKTYKILVNKPSTYMDFMLPHHGKYLLKELVKIKAVNS